MQIWMVAMLAVSAVLILRDMAKLVFTGRKKGRPVYDVYPQKEKIDRYARSLQKLAHTFYEMPGRQEQLSQAEVQDMFVQVQQRVCMECSLGSATRLSGLQRSCSASFLKLEKNCCIAIG